MVAAAIIHGFGLVHLPCPKNGITGIRRFSESPEVYEQERHRQCHQNEPRTQIFAHTSLLSDSNFLGESIIRLPQVSFGKTVSSVMVGTAEGCYSKRRVPRPRAEPIESCREGGRSGF